MEEIAEGVLKSLGSLIKWFLWDMLFHVLLYYIGKASLLLITFGRYPRKHETEKEVNLISLFGFFILFLIWLSISLYNNWWS